MSLSQLCYFFGTMTDSKLKVVCITGATSGIGMACAKAFAALKSDLILIGRRKERLQQLTEELSKDFKIETISLPLDVRDNEDVTRSITSLPLRWQEIDLLINNAGLARGLAPIHEGNFEHWEEMIDTNIKGLLYVTRAVTPLLVKRGCGHIINIGSIAGHEVYPRGTVYCATKHAIRALTQGLRAELLGTGIRVTTVDPGLVRTEFSMVRFDGDATRAKPVYEKYQPLEAHDIAEVVRYCATLPAHVNINEIVVMPTDQASTVFSVVNKG